MGADRDTEIDEDTDTYVAMNLARDMNMAMNRDADSGQRHAAQFLSVRHTKRTEESPLCVYLTEGPRTPRAPRIDDKYQPALPSEFNCYILWGSW